MMYSLHKNADAAPFSFVHYNMVPAVVAEHTGRDEKTVHYLLGKMRSHSDGTKRIFIAGRGRNPGVVVMSGYKP